MITKISAITVLAFFLSIVLVIAEAKEETITLNIRGMACGQCAKRVEDELKKMDGVKEAKVNFEDAKAVIKIEKDKINAEQLSEAIIKMGFMVVKEKK